MYYSVPSDFYSLHPGSVNHYFMKIALLGGTSLANTLGKKYMDTGISVVFGVAPDFDSSVPEWRVISRFLNKIQSYQEAIREAEIILICCRNEVLAQIIKILKQEDLSTKILVDCTNNRYRNKLETSNVNRLKRAAPGVSVFKAFNNLGLDYPAFDSLGVIKEVYFCGPNNSAKTRIKRLIELIGFKAVDAGDLENAALLEAFYHLGKQLSETDDDNIYQFKLISV